MDITDIRSNLPLSLFTIAGQYAEPSGIIRLPHQLSMFSESYMPELYLWWEITVDQEYFIKLEIDAQEFSLQPGTALALHLSTHGNNYYSLTVVNQLSFSEWSMFGHAGGLS